MLLGKSSGIKQLLLARISVIRWSTEISKVYHLGIQQLAIKEKKTDRKREAVKKKSTFLVNLNFLVSGAKVC